MLQTPEKSVITEPLICGFALFEYTWSQQHSMPRACLVLSGAVCYVTSCTALQTCTRASSSVCWTTEGFNIYKPLQLPISKDKNAAKNWQKICLHFRTANTTAFESPSAYFSFLVQHTALLLQKCIISLPSNNHTQSIALHYKHWTYRKFNCTLALKSPKSYMQNNIFIYFSLL